jgi:hypothetical protein
MRVLGFFCAVNFNDVRYIDLWKVFMKDGYKLVCRYLQVKMLEMLDTHYCSAHGGCMLVLYFSISRIMIPNQVEKCNLDELTKLLKTKKFVRNKPEYKIEWHCLLTLCIHMTIEVFPSHETWTVFSPTQSESTGLNKGSYMAFPGGGIESPSSQAKWILRSRILDLSRGAKSDKTERRYKKYQRERIHMVCRWTPLSDGRRCMVERRDALASRPWSVLQVLLKKDELKHGRPEKCSNKPKTRQSCWRLNLREHNYCLPQRGLNSAYDNDIKSELSQIFWYLRRSAWPLRDGLEVTHSTCVRHCRILQ